MANTIYAVFSKYNFYHCKLSLRISLFSTCNFPWSTISLTICSQQQQPPLDQLASATLDLACDLNTNDKNERYDGDFSV